MLIIFYILLVMRWPLGLECLCLICAFCFLAWYVTCWIQCESMDANKYINTAERRTTCSASLNTCLGLCAARPVRTTSPRWRCSKCFGQVGNLTALSDIFWRDIVVTSLFSQEVERVQSANDTLVLIGMNLEHNVFLIYI